MAEYKTLVNSVFTDRAVHVNDLLSTLFLDIYDSIKQPLINLSSKVVINGIIVIDDFILNDNNQNNESFPGARKAVEEFLFENTNFIIKESIRGTPFLLRIK